jgi:DNA processing protein
LAPIVHLTPLDAAYPPRLRVLADAPASITVQGGDVDAMHTVAVVGSRAAVPEAAVYARELAAALASAGVVVVSGGAEGIDAAAHEGALAVNGRTWAVAGTGHLRCFPAAHAKLYESIGRGPGAMVWPFPPDYHARSAFLARNRVLAALADALVVVQAGIPSGALQAARWARRLGKPLWVVPAAPWMRAFEGSHQLLEEGARPLASRETLLSSLGLAASHRAEPLVPPAQPLAFSELSDDPGGAASGPESQVLGVLSTTPSHLDAISARAKLSPQAAAAALLTLALENVVVESPPGFFCRRIGRNI